MIDALARGREATMVGRPSNYEALLLDGGEGALVWDKSGRKYIDCTAQAWTLNVGYNHPRVLAAAQKQMDALTHNRTSFDTEPCLRLTARLAELAPIDSARISYALHGSVAVEGAMKLALRNRPERENFLTLFDGYHGRTLATMAASWPSAEGTFLPFMKNVVRIPQAYCYRCPLSKSYPECEIACADFAERMIQKAVDGRPVALIMEPVQGNGGQIDFPPEYYQRIRELCDHYEILLIWDEIQTAFGRVGSLFAAELYDVEPDIIVFGKAIGGGFPLAGTISRGDLEPFEAGEHMFTFGHFPVSMAAALATLDVIEDENLLERSRQLGSYITSRLTEFQERYSLIGDVRGPGLMIGVELVKDRETREPAFDSATEFVELGLEHGVIFATSKWKGLGNVVKIKPPLVISDAQVERVLEAFENILITLES